jgi:hypothetical protein
MHLHRRAEKNIDLHFETNVKENSLLLKLETLIATHLKNITIADVKVFRKFFAHGI